MTDPATTPEPQEDPYAGMRAARPWLQWIEDTSRYYKAWQDACDNIDRQYASAERLRNNIDREFQIFWANLEVVRPSIYARMPVPVVGARFKDRKPLMDEVQLMMAEEGRELPIYYNVLPYVMREDLQGFKGSGTNLGSFWNVYEWSLGQ